MIRLASPWSTLLLFFATIGLLLVMRGYFPQQLAIPLPEANIAPVLLFEFASEPVHLEHIFGPAGTPEHDARVTGMNWGNALDYLLMPAYALLTLSFFAGVAQRTGNAKWLWAGWMGVLAALADAIENAVLFSIVADMSDPFAEMAMLPFPVWLKFGLLALTCGAAAIALWQLRRYLLALLCLPAPLMLIPGMIQPLTIGPTATTLIGLGWLAMALDAIGRLLARRKAHTA